MFKGCVNISYKRSAGCQDYFNGSFGSINSSGKFDANIGKNRSLFKYLYNVENASEMFYGCDITFCNKYMFMHQGSEATNDLWDESQSFADSETKNNYGLGARVEYINTSNMLSGGEYYNGAYVVFATISCLYPIITKTGSYHSGLLSRVSGKPV